MKMLKLFSFYLFIISIIGSNSYGLEFQTTFSENSLKESGDLIWDIEDGKLFPPIHVRNYNDGLGFLSLDLDPGDGSLGEFTISTYHNFSINQNTSGQVITLNTDAFPVLNFTNFILEEGWVLRPVGSKPLTIKVLGNMEIHGTIDCSGENGEDLNSNPNHTNLGGIGRCGGGDGGQGGTQILIPHSGMTSGENVTGGSGGDNSNLTISHGGGGGGGYGDTGGGADAPQYGTDSAGAAVTDPGTHFNDNAFEITGGGSGGGGGSAYVNLSPEDSSGGGGGAGGGVVTIVVFKNIIIGSNGKVFANGGDGGKDNSNLKAGGGGGGAGGSVSIFSAGNFTNNGLVEAKAGAGGVTSALNSGDGGLGGNGRTWISEKDIIPDGSGTIDPPTFLLVAGAVRFKTGEFYITSKAIDLKNSFPNFIDSQVQSEINGASDVSLQVAFGNKSQFVVSSWRDIQDNIGLTSRYFRFKITLNNQSANPPSYIDSLSFEYNPYLEKDFHFVGGCGKIENQKANPNLPLFLLVIPLLFILILRKVSLHRLS